jgi:hypothetical protein
MDRVLESMDQCVQVGRENVASQERRVERQRRAIAQLEQAGHNAVENSRTVLVAMEDLLLQMREELAEAEHRWAERISQNAQYPGSGISGS